MADAKVNLALKLEADRVESADYVLWALETHGETVVTRLETRPSPTVRPALADAGLAAPRVMIEWFHENVSRIRAELVKSGRVHRSAKIERASCWGRLEGAARTAGTAVSGVRDQFFSTYGEDFSLRLGFARQTPQRYVELQEYLGYLLERLSQPLDAMPEPAPGRLPIDVPAQVALIKPLYEEMKDARDCYHVARRETHAAMLQRNEAVESYDDDFPWLAGGFENLLRMAGLKPLAAAVRPSLRRKGLIALVAGEASEPDEPGGEDPVSDEEPTPPPAGDPTPEPAFGLAPVKSTSKEPASYDPVFEEPSDSEFAEIDSSLATG